MEDMRNSRRAPATLALAPVVRQFDGSRVERLVLAQVFDLVWQIKRDAASHLSGAAARLDRASRGEYLSRIDTPRNRSRHKAAAVVGHGSEKGGTP